MGYIITITGAIGSGKSMLAKQIKSKNPRTIIIEPDHIAHQLYQQKKIQRVLFKIFGTGIFYHQTIKKNIKNTVHRPALLKQLIKYPQKWNILNTYIHPIITKKIEQYVKIIPKNNTVVIPCALPQILPIFHQKNKHCNIHLQTKREYLYRKIKKTRNMSRKIFYTFWNKQKY